MHLLYGDRELAEKLTPFVSPTKQTYNPSDLGFSPASYCGNTLMERRDFALKNSRSEQLACSLYQCNRSPPQTTTSGRTVVIFLHGNGGSRLDGVSVVRSLGCSLSIDICTFDFSGCGRSDGDYSTLGLKEEQDLLTVVEYLCCGKNSHSTYEKVILFGRSMGGVTALLFCSKRRELAARVVVGLIIDSAFCSLRQLACDLARTRFSSLLGGVVVGLSIPHVRGLLVKLLDGYDIFSLEMTQHASSLRDLRIPSIFAYSEEDTLVQSYHSKELISSYGELASKLVFQGEHNAIRPEGFYERIRAFVREIARLKELIEPAVTVMLPLKRSLPIPVARVPQIPQVRERPSEGLTQLRMSYEKDKLSGITQLKDQSAATAVSDRTALEKEKQVDLQGFVTSRIAEKRGVVGVSLCQTAAEIRPKFVFDHNNNSSYLNYSQQPSRRISTHDNANTSSKHLRISSSHMCLATSMQNQLKDSHSAVGSSSNRQAVAVGNNPAVSGGQIYHVPANQVQQQTLQFQHVRADNKHANAFLSVPVLQKENSENNVTASRPFEVRLRVPTSPSASGMRVTTLGGGGANLQRKRIVTTSSQRIPLEMLSFQQSPNPSRETRILGGLRLPERNIVLSGGGVYQQQMHSTTIDRQIR